MELADKSSPVQHTVASLSTLQMKPVEPLFQDFLPCLQNYDEHQKKHHNRTKKVKQAKKDSVHLAPAEVEMTQNIQVSSEVSPN
jgi:hypothetical protein